MNEKFVLLKRIADDGIVPPSLCAPTYRAPTALTRYFLKTLNDIFPIAFPSSYFVDIFGIDEWLNTVCHIN